MNVRLTSSSLRIRVDLAEAQTLLAGQRVGFEFSLGNSTGLAFELELVDGDEISARLEAGTLTVYVPREGLEAAILKVPSRSAGVYGSISLDGRDVELAVEIDVKRPRSSRS